MPPDTKQKTLRIFIADDHELVRDGIRARLENCDFITIIGEASNGVEVLDQVEDLKPDLILLDINMPRMGGLQTLAELRQQDIRCKTLILSLHENPEYARKALKLGANGYLLKDVTQEEMIQAIVEAAGGATPISPSIGLVLEPAVGDAEPNSVENEASAQTSAAAAVSETDISDPYNLTQREREVLAAIAAGKPNKLVAADLNISVRTVESHRSAIRLKTGGGNAASLAKIAVELSLD